MSTEAISYTPMAPQRLSPNNERNQMLKMAGFGLLVRLYGLGIQRRPMRAAPFHTVAFMAVGAVSGYYINKFEQRAVVIIADRTNIIIESRVRRANKIQQALEAELARVQAEAA